MFLRILDVFSVSHNVVAFQFLVLIMNLLNAWEVVLPTLLSVRVSFFFNVRDLVLFAIFSLGFWISWVGRKFAVSILDMVRLEIGSWSSAELIVTCAFFGILSTFCCTAPLDVMAVWFSWPPLEVGVGYRSGASCLGMSGAIGFLCGLDSIVLPF